MNEEKKVEKASKPAPKKVEKVNVKMCKPRLGAYVYKDVTYKQYEVVEVDADIADELLVLKDERNVNYFCRV